MKRTRVVRMTTHTSDEDGVAARDMTLEEMLEEFCDRVMVMAASTGGRPITRAIFTPPGEHTGDPLTQVAAARIYWEE